MFLIALVFGVFHGRSRRQHRQMQQQLDVLLGVAATGNCSTCGARLYAGHCPNSTPEGHASGWWDAARQPAA